jgi:hypothetical protein
VVLISLGVLQEDAVLGLVGFAIGVAGLLLVVVLGAAVAKGVGSLF